MSIFKSKKVLNSKTMMNLVYETTRLRSSEVEPILERGGIQYNPLENQLVVMAVNFEIFRWELAKANPRNIVDLVVDSSYQRFYGSLNIDSDTIRRYQVIMTNAKDEIDKVLFFKGIQSAAKNVLVYETILELQNINPNTLSMQTKQELEYICATWLKVAKDTSDQYKIVDDPKTVTTSAPIDFDF